MDISKELKTIEDNLEKEHYDVVVQRVLLLIEQKLREVVKHDLPHLKGAEQLKVFAHFTEKKKLLDELTMGEVVGLLRETKFLEGWKQRNQKELHVFETIDLNKLIALRNATAHGKSLVYTKIDAELVIAYQRMVFQTFAHDSEPSKNVVIHQTFAHDSEPSRNVVIHYHGDQFISSGSLTMKTGEFRDKLRDGTDAPAMVWLPKGRFMMGSNERDSEKPIHEVTIDYELAVGKYQVTFAEYDKFCDSTRQKKPEDKGWGRGNRPVINVNWNDARGYCEWLSEQTGQVYRLLSEAEWEYACRAGSTGKYCFGDDVHQLASYGWFSGNSGGKTHPVGEKKPNQFGLYDMHGNVWEWCEDVWHENYNGAPTDGNAWVVGGDSNNHLLRGGCWNGDDNNLRCAIRGWNGTTYRDCNNYGGFRVSRM